MVPLVWHSRRFLSLPSQPVHLHTKERRTKALLPPVGRPSLLSFPLLRLHFFLANVSLSRSTALVFRISRDRLENRDVHVCAVEAIDGS